MSHWDWMNEHMSGFGAGHWWAMGLGWIVIIAALVAVGFALGRMSRRPPDDRD